MARIAGVNIPTNKRVVIALQYIHEGARDRVQGGHRGRPAGQPADRPGSPADPRDHRPATIRWRAICVAKTSVNIKRLMDLACYRGLRPPQGPAGPRSAHPHQRPHPQGAGQADRRQEEIRAHVTWPRKPARVKKRERKNITSGVAHVNASFNNTMITITDAQGQHHLLVIGRGQWASRARASRTPYAAQMAGRGCGQEGRGAWRQDAGSERLRPGFGPRIGAAGPAGRRHDESPPSVDVTPIPHNGCRPPKRRRV